MNTMKLIAVFLAAVLAAPGVRADTWTDPSTGYTWTYRINGETAEIGNTFVGAAVSPAPDGAVAIPSVLGGKPVAGIGDNAFLNCSGLTDVTIPDSVTRIGDAAFRGCTALASVTIPDGVTSLGGAAFANCCGLTRVVIPDGVTAIEGSLFAECTNLLHVTIGDGVASIGAGAFVRCSGLRSVTIPDGVASIGDRAFLDCGELASVTIGAGVTNIGAGAFYRCGALTGVTIPDSVVRIGDEAFYYCRGLVGARIGSRVTRIGNGAFDWCLSLVSVTLPQRFEGTLDASVFANCPSGKRMNYYSTPYTLVFHRNDARTEKTASCAFEYGVPMPLPTIAKLGWARRGLDFLGWATSAANADAGKIWKADGAAVSTAADVGATLDAWAVWALEGNSYAIKFIRNDGAGTWRTVGFRYGVKTRIPSLANGLGWARRGFDFMGWELTTAAANDNTRAAPWKGDWAYVATPTDKGTVLMTYARWKLKPGYYQIRFNKNDGTGKWRTLGFECDKSTKLSTIAGLGWERPGYTFKGWASNAANAAAGKVWKTDGEWVKNATAEGRTLSIYAIWE